MNTPFTMPNTLPAAAATDLESALRSFIEQRELPLYRIMSFQLGWVSETGEPSGLPAASRPHGVLALAAAHAAGGNYRQALAHAVAIELADNFHQIHSDVQDGNTERDGRPSVWWTWGPAQAINAGDGMHAMARLALFQLQREGVDPGNLALVLATFDKAIVLLSEGEYLDISYQDRPVLSTGEYLKMAEARSGALAACAVMLGGLAPGSLSASAAARLHEFGLKLGAARQVAGDMSALWGDRGRSAAQHGRLVAKKKSLPVAHAMSTADPTTRRKLGDIYVQRVLDPSVIKTVADLLSACGSRTFTHDTLARLLAEADSSLVSAGLDANGTALLRETARDFVGATPA